MSKEAVRKEAGDGRSFDFTHTCSGNDEVAKRGTLSGSKTLRSSMEEGDSEWKEAASAGGLRSPTGGVGSSFLT